MIDQELISLYKDFCIVGSVQATVTSLDERGRNIVILKEAGVRSDPKTYCLNQEKFYKYYVPYTGSGSFSLFEMDPKYVEKAKKHIEALKLLVGDCK